jgi:hypothetical protein
VFAKWSAKGKGNSLDDALSVLLCRKGNSDDGGQVDRHAGTAPEGRDDKSRKAGSDTSHCLTIADLHRRPTISIREYASFLGVSPDCAYEAAARGELRVLKCGRRLLVPTAPLLVELGYEVEKTHGMSSEGK